MYLKACGISIMVGELTFVGFYKLQMLSKRKNGGIIVAN